MVVKTRKGWSWGLKVVEAQELVCRLTLGEWGKRPMGHIYIQRGFLSLTFDVFSSSGRRKQTTDSIVSHGHLRHPPLQASVSGMETGEISVWDVSKILGGSRWGFWGLKDSHFYKV